MTFRFACELERCSGYRSCSMNIMHSLNQYGRLLQPGRIDAETCIRFSGADGRGTLCTHPPPPPAPLPLTRVQAQTVASECVCVYARVAGGRL